MTLNRPNTRTVNAQRPTNAPLQQLARAATNVNRNPNSNRNANRFATVAVKNMARVNDTTLRANTNTVKTANQVVRATNAAIKNPTSSTAARNVAVAAVNHAAAANLAHVNAAPTRATNAMMPRPNSKSLKSAIKATMATGMATGTMAHAAQNRKTRKQFFTTIINEQNALRQQKQRQCGHRDCENVPESIMSRNFKRYRDLEKTPRELVLEEQKKVLKNLHRNFKGKKFLLDSWIASGVNSPFYPEMERNGRTMNNLHKYAIELEQIHKQLPPSDDPKSNQSKYNPINYEQRVILGLDLHKNQVRLEREQFEARHALSRYLKVLQKLTTGNYNATQFDRILPSFVALMKQAYAQNKTGQLVYYNAFGRQLAAAHRELQKAKPEMWQKVKYNLPARKTILRRMWGA